MLNSVVIEGYVCKKMEEELDENGKKLADVFFLKSYFRDGSNATRYNITKVKCIGALMKHFEKHSSEILGRRIIVFGRFASFAQQYNCVVAVAYSLINTYQNSVFNLSEGITPKVVEIEEDDVAEFDPETFGVDNPSEIPDL